MRFEQLLSETIDEMTGELPTAAAGLASRSIAEGRRIRRTRRLTAAAGAVLAVLAIALPWAVLPRGEHPEPGVRRTTAGPGLPGGWVVTGAGTHVLDRAAGEYVDLRGNRTVLPAPVGDRVLIEAGQEPPQVLDVRGGHRVTIDSSGFAGNYRWSPRGDQLVVRIVGKHSGFAVIDAGSGAVARYPVDGLDCGRCDYTWSRDGSAIIVTVADRSGPGLVARLQGFDAATGRPTATLPVPATPTGPYSWSPGGRYVIADSGAPDRRWLLIDVTSGQATPFPYDAVWVTADELLAVHDGKVLALTPDGTVTATADPGVADLGPLTLGPPG